MFNISTRTKKAVVVLEKEVFTVLSSFTFKNLIRDAGDVLEMTAAEAKYHLLANRVVKGLVDPHPAPVPAPASADGDE